MLLKCGASVVVPSHNREHWQALTERIVPDDHERLIGIPANATKRIGAQEVRRTISRRFDGQLDLVVAAVDSRVPGPALKDLELDSWNQLVERHLTSHLVLAQTFLPLLRRGGRYLIIGRATGQGLSFGTGPLPAIEAAKMVLARTLAVEEEEGGANVTELVLERVGPSDREEDSDGWISVEEIGLFVACLMEVSSQEDLGQTIHLGNRMHLMEELQGLPIFDA